MNLNKDRLVYGGGEVRHGILKVLRFCLGCSCCCYAPQAKSLLKYSFTVGGWSVCGLQGNVQLCSLRVGKYGVMQPDLGACVARFVDLTIHTQIIHRLKGVRSWGLVGLYCHLVAGRRGDATTRDYLRMS